MAIEVGVYTAPGKQPIQVTHVAGPFALYRQGDGRQKATLRHVLALDLRGYRRGDGSAT